ncbi:hypothetical protein D8674_007946 [Pyrus ussuriensis x Pyrus communis]|uniref:Methyltransferase type 11 domain-containing protein n=1 Tax=Pyrus ussuriensis x Pyrus communis TaxID=2448454 RepID=A0A5N5HU96_9ROSA|nr:hypothetical protein D8674_007946 [Pyrus ussuriensis x Pyrus communis]
MEPGAAAAGKPGLLKNVFVRLFLFGVLIVLCRFAYVVTVTGESCELGDFCFFSLPENLNFVIANTGGTAIAVRNEAVPSILAGSTKPDLYTSKDWIKAVHFYSAVFQDLMSQGFLSRKAKSLCVETPAGHDVYALRESGVKGAVGVFKKASRPLVIPGEVHRLPFADNSFDFVFSAGGRLEKSPKPADFAAEIVRTLKPEGFAVVHVGARDTYSFHSFIELFNCSKLVTSRDIDGFDSSMPKIREMVLRKDCGESEGFGHRVENPGGSAGNKCSVPGHKMELIRKAEPLIEIEPLKPWITLKKNIQNVKYLPTMADISFKKRYAYVDVGARSYGSSIGSWFKKQYPKQNKTFEVFAIEADKTFHDQYKLKKGVTLLPYAAWVRNETLSFEINGDPGEKVKDKGRGMGRIQPANPANGGFNGEVDRIQGFDFANWLKNTFSEKDFVVMKMDVEGTEFDLIPRLFETGAICLIDEVFLECHYNRWQRCCPGERSSKYEKSYGQCLDLFASLRQSGVLVHQWW